MEYQKVRKEIESEAEKVACLALFNETNKELREELRKNNEQLMQSMKELDPVEFRAIEEDVQKIRLKLLIELCSRITV